MSPIRLFRSAHDSVRQKIAISSEAPVERYDWRLNENGGVYREILDHGPNGPDLSYCRDGLPFLLDHELDDQIGLAIQRSRLAVDDDEFRAVPPCDQREGGRRIDHERRADGEEQIGLQGPLLRPRHRRLRHGLAKGDGCRLHDAAAGAAGLVMVWGLPAGIAGEEAGRGVGRDAGRAAAAEDEPEGAEELGRETLTDAVHGDAGFRHRFTGDRKLGLPDLQGIVLDPSGLRENLSEFTLGRCHDPRLSVDHQRARTGGALV